MSASYNNRSNANAVPQPESGGGLSNFMRVLPTAVLAGIIASVAILSAVVMSGQTFGQRCEAMGYKGKTAEFDECVKNLSKGG